MSREGVCVFVRNNGAWVRVAKGCLENCDCGMPDEPSIGTSDGEVAITACFGNTIASVGENNLIELNEGQQLPEVEVIRPKLLSNEGELIMDENADFGKHTIFLMNSPQLAKRLLPP